SRKKKTPHLRGFSYSPDWTRTSNPPVNSRMLYQLSYRGRQRRDCSRGAGAPLAGRTGARRGELGAMRRFAVAGVAVSIGVLAFAPDGLAASARVAALQVGLRAYGFDPGPIDGVRGPQTKRALISFQRTHGVRPTGRVGRATRRALGTRGHPLLGQRELGVGAVGWDVAVLEFRLRRFGLVPAAVDGKFTASTGSALRRFQRRRGLAADGIAGPHTYRALAGRAPTQWHVVVAGESFFSIAARYHVSPWRLARRNKLSLMAVIVPGQRLALPRGARLHSAPTASPIAS